MKYMISGYGTGSRTGSQETKQFKTLRVSVADISTAVKVLDGGVVVDSKPVMTLEIGGSTRKVGKETVDNNVSLLFHSMTVEEAMKMSAEFAKFARYLAGEHPDQAAAVSKEIKREFTSRPVNTMSVIDRNALGEFLENIRFEWKNQESSVVGNRQFVDDFERLDIWTKANPEKHPDHRAGEIKAWLATCIQKIDDLSRYFTRGLEEEQGAANNDIPEDRDRRSADIIQLRPDKP